MDSLENVDSQWAYWKRLFGEIVECHAPTKKAREKRKSLPWISREICAMMRATNYFFFNNAKKSRKVENWEKFKKVRNQLHATNCLWKANYKLDYFEEMSKHSIKN